MTTVTTKSIQSEKKYWHELSQEEVDKISMGGMTIGEVLKNYKQPDWCTYPDALSGMMGCWSLMDDDIRLKISKKFCKKCELFKSEK